MLDNTGEADFEDTDEDSDAIVFFHRGIELVIKNKFKLVNIMGTTDETNYIKKKLGKKYKHLVI